jgi:GNAT superfamily N-acetyltransferase
MTPDAKFGDEIVSEIKIGWSKFRHYPHIARFDVFLGDRRLDMQRGEILVATTEGDVAIAYARITRAEFMNWPLLSAVCVREDYRRQSIGYRLVNRLIEQPQITRIYSTTEGGNTPMLELFAKIGAKSVGYIDDLNMSGERELVFRLK